MNKIKSSLWRIACSPLVSMFMSSTGLIRLWADYKVKSSKRGLLTSAKRMFEKGIALGSLDDYKKALEKHWVSYSEYAYQYEFYNKTEVERNEFVSRMKMGYYYRMYTPGPAKFVFRTKPKFLTIFNKYIHREWLYVPEVSFEEFERLITSYDCIVKPCDESLGKGIFKIYKDSDHKNDRQLYNNCVVNKMLVEECIESCDELKALHPESLNTIRVVTVSNNKNAEVFGSFLRMGMGDSIVDNAHAGGVFAQINIKDGTIESDGIDTNGNRYVCHPDSGIKLKGFQIPYWNEIVETCCEAAKLTQNTINGWDVAINSKGVIEFVEGNHRPDFDVMQSPLQIGVKKKIFALIKEYSGVVMK